MKCPNAKVDARLRAFWFLSKLIDEAAALFFVCFLLIVVVLALLPYLVTKYNF